MRSVGWFVVCIAACRFEAGQGPSLNTTTDAATGTGVDTARGMIVDAAVDGSPAITTEQAEETEQGGGTTVTCTFTSAQIAGNLNLVAVAWFGGQQVQSVVDSNGNSYTQQATDALGQLNQDIYYAANIKADAAGSNTVTLTFNGSVNDNLDLRIVEYAGVSTTNPIDASAAASGASGTAMDSGAFQTTHANDLLVGVASDTAGTSSAGASYTTDVLAWGDLVEHQKVTATGSYHATATQATSGSWVMRGLALAPRSE